MTKYQNLWRAKNSHLFWVLNFVNEGLFRLEIYPI